MAHKNITHEYRNQDKIKIFRIVSLTFLSSGILSLFWFYRPWISSYQIPPIIDEYMVTMYARWVLDGLLPYRDFFSATFPGSFYFYAVIMKLLGSNMDVIRLINVLMVLLLGCLVLIWYRTRHHDWSVCMTAAFFVSGPCAYLWPIITYHIPAMISYTFACLLLFWPHHNSVGDLVKKRIRWFASGVFFFCSGWCLQTYAALALMTLIGVMIFNINSIKRRTWLPWLLVGILLPCLIWFSMMIFSNQWHTFYGNTIEFIFQSYRKSGNINDVPIIPMFQNRIQLETLLVGKTLVTLTSILILVLLFLAPFITLLSRFSVQRAFWFPSFMAPVIYLSGRTDSHHAFYLVIPAILMISTCDQVRQNIEAEIGISTFGATLGLLFFLISLPYLVSSTHLGFSFGQPPRREAAAVQALREMGVKHDEPVAVMPWASNLYMHGVIPGHRFAYLATPAQRFHRVQDWLKVQAQMQSQSVQWLAFYPASYRSAFQHRGMWAGFLQQNNRQLQYVGTRNGVELWKYY